MAGALIRKFVGDVGEIMIVRFGEILLGFGQWFGHEE